MSRGQRAQAVRHPREHATRPTPRERDVPCEMGGLLSRTSAYCYGDPENLQKGE